jgi:hypothetical protein
MADWWDWMKQRADTADERWKRRLDAAVDVLTMQGTDVAEAAFEAATSLGETPEDQQAAYYLELSRWVCSGASYEDYADRVNRLLGMIGTVDIGWRPEPPSLEQYNKLRELGGCSTPASLATTTGVPPQQVQARARGWWFGVGVVGAVALAAIGYAAYWAGTRSR